MMIFVLSWYNILQSWCIFGLASFENDESRQIFMNPGHGLALVRALHIDLSSELIGGGGAQVGNNACTMYVLHMK